MPRYFLLLSISFLVSCSTTRYYIVRHAEKETATAMSSDVPLSEAGRQRAEALNELLKNEHIQHIYSTNYVRTRQTAQPLASSLGKSIELYQPGDTSFIHRIRNEKDNVLIVGHSNTVDDLVNGLMQGKSIATDLPETQYGDLFIVKRKGKKFSFEQRKFGQ